LESRGIELFEGDLARPETLAPCLEGVDVVVHAAAHIGDWGPAENYRAINVVALEHLLTAALHQGDLKRWIQISSLGVYPAVDHFGTDETLPIDAAGLDGYTRTKAEAEIVVRDHIRRDNLPAVILRPGFIYGPGDRHVVPRLVERFEGGLIKFIGPGDKLLNNVYVGNLIDAIFQAIETDEAVGETFNLRDARLVTRREYLQAVADHLDKQLPGSIPLWLAKLLVGPIEGWAKLRGRTEAPLLTKARIKFMAVNLDFSIAKAQRILEYQPRVDFREGFAESLAWFEAQRKQADRTLAAC
jgi:nucleoside-diphosphate-sugar epimerase